MMTFPVWLPGPKCLPGGPCRGGGWVAVHGDPRYGKELAVRILLECILVSSNSFFFLFGKGKFRYVKFSLGELFWSY